MASEIKVDTISENTVNNGVAFGQPAKFKSYTTSERDSISSPAAGMTIFNSTTNQLNVYDGSSWGAVGGGSTSLATILILGE